VVFIVTTRFRSRQKKGLENIMLNEIQVIDYIIQKFSSFRSPRNKFYYSIKKISTNGLRSFPTTLAGHHISSISDLKSFFESQISTGIYMPKSPSSSKLFGNGWDLEILGRTLNGKSLNSDKRKFLIECKGGSSKDANITNYIIRALGQALFIHKVDAYSNTNICVAFPKSWQPRFIQIVDNDSYRLIMKIFHRNRLFIDIEPLLKGVLSTDDIEKIRKKIRKTIPFDTTYFRVLFVSDNGNVEVYQPSGDNPSKIL